MRTLIAMLLILAMYAPVAAAPRQYSGFAARYRPGLMERVADKRGIPLQRCMIAATHEPIGTWLIVTSSRTGRSARCLVVDIPASQHKSSIVQRGIVVELDHAWAVPLCGSARERPKDCPVTVTR